MCGVGEARSLELFFSFLETVTPLLRPRAGASFSDKALQAPRSHELVHYVQHRASAAGDVRWWVVALLH